MSEPVAATTSLSASVPVISAYPRKSSIPSFKKCMIRWSVPGKRSPNSTTLEIAANWCHSATAAQIGSASDRFWSDVTHVTRALRDRMASLGGARLRGLRLLPPRGITQNKWRSPIGAERSSPNRAAAGSKRGEAPTGDAPGARLYGPRRVARGREWPCPSVYGKGERGAVYRKGGPWSARRGGIPSRAACIMDDDRARTTCGARAVNRAARLPPAGALDHDA